MRPFLFVLAWFLNLFEERLIVVNTKRAGKKRER